MAEKKAPNKALLIAAAAVLLGAAGWFAWQHFNAPPPAPPPPPPKAARPAAAPAAPAAVSPDKAIETLLQVSGMEHFFTRLPEQMLSAMRQAVREDKSGRLTPADMAEVERLTREAFSAQGFRQRVAAALKQSYDEKRFQEFIADSSTPLARRMTELEKHEATQAEMAAFLDGLKTKPLAATRIKLVERIDMAARASDLAAESMFATVAGMARGLAGGDPKQVADADRAIGQQRAAAAENIRNAVRFTLALTYRDVSDSDLAEYARLHEKPNTQFVLGLMFDALVAEFRSGAERLGAGLEKLFRARQPVRETATQPVAAAAAPQPTARSRAREDARECLRFEENRQVMGCAEKFR